MQPGDQTRLIFNLNIDSLRLDVLKCLSQRELDLQTMVNMEFDRMRLEFPTLIRGAIQKCIREAIADAANVHKMKLQQAFQAIFASELDDRLDDILEEIRDQYE